MEQHKRPWNPTLIVVAKEPDEDLTGKERRALQADVRYWKDSSKHKDEDLKYKNNQIRGLKAHITRLQAALHKKGVYKI